MMASGGLIRIGEVVARTGLSERSIRHYERLGLVRSHRSAAGQRLFGPEAMTALASVQLLKRAGFKLRQIKQLLSKTVDARTLVAAQLALLRAEANAVRHAITLLEAIETELATSSKTADLDLVVRVLQAGAPCDVSDQTRAFFETLFTPQQRAEWGEMQGALSAQVNVKAYDQAWADLARDVEAALGAKPSSARAQALLDRWNALLQPFKHVATAEQQEAAKTMWSRVGEWGAGAKQPVTQAVVDFIRAASAAREARKGARKRGQN